MGIYIYQTVIRINENYMSGNPLYSFRIRKIMSLTSHASSLKIHLSDMPFNSRGTIGTVAHHRVERTIITRLFYSSFHFITLCNLYVTLSFAWIFCSF